MIAALLLAAATASASPAPMVAGTAGTAVQKLDPKTVGDELAAAFAKTQGTVEKDIVSEVQNGGYRIGLIIGPARPIRPRMLDGMYMEPSTPDSDLTFVGVVLREPRTERFLPNATVTADLEYEGGGETELPELTGPYPVYGANLRLPPKGSRWTLQSIGVHVSPPAYNRHAEMLGAFTGEGSARFHTAEPAKKGGLYTVIDPKRPDPPASDWTLGNDLKQAVSESRELVRYEGYVVGFIAEGPEPIWLWTGSGQAPQHCPVGPKDTNHLEAILIDGPTGVNVTGASVVYRFSRKKNAASEPEVHDYLMRPLLADFYHYGLTTEVPPGTWTVTMLAVPPRIEAWGTGHIVSPQQQVIANFDFTREAPAGSTGSVDEAQAFSDAITNAASKYQTGDHPGGAQDVTDSFFRFEGSSLDARLRAADPGAYRTIEADWIALRQRMQENARPGEIGVLAQKVSNELVAAAEKNPAPGAGGGTPGASAFVSSLVILLREGLEAILVLGVLAAVLRRTGKPEGLRLVYGGAGAGVAASLLLAAVGAAIFRHVGGGAAQEGFEGVTLLIAVVVLFFTSFWLISKVEGRRWAAFVKNKVESAVTGGRKAAIVSLAFLVVFREGAETVLFYASLFASSRGAVAQVLAGILVGAVGLAIVFQLSVRGGAKLPIRPFFAVTGGLLYLLAFKFAGDGVNELQAAGILRQTRLGWIPDVAALKAWLGIYPTVQSAVLQALLLIAVIAGLAWTMTRKVPPKEMGATAG